MDAWMAFVSIMAIVAIVVVAGGIIAFIGHVIIGAFDNKKVVNNTKELLDYSQYKQLEDTRVKDAVVTAEYNFEEINKAKAKKEQELAKNDTVADDFKLEDVKDDDLEDLENRIKLQNETKVEEKTVEKELDFDDDLDLDNLLNEISNDVTEEEKGKIHEDNAPKMDESLANYSIEDYLKSFENEEAEDIEDIEENVEEPIVEEPIVEEPIVEETVVEEVKEEVEDAEEIVEDNTEVEETIEEEVSIEPIIEEVVEEKAEEKAEEKVVEKVVDNSEEIERLKAELADLNRQLEEARSGKVEVVTINMTEAECVNRLEVLEERLKNVKKDYKINQKEYRPLKKIINDLDKYQSKLRRKENMVAKKKVALYGVNNYVDIDKEKAEKLANELDLLDGLRLSVQHCEEVINANKDRFPILERTNNILEDQIAHLEADIATTQKQLEKIRADKGEDEGDKE